MIIIGEKINGAIPSIRQAISERNEAMGGSGPDLRPGGDPCRFPEKAMSSMEGYGLFVTQVCRDVGVPYHYGDRTITYSACILY